MQPHSIWARMVLERLAEALESYGGTSPEKVLYEDPAPVDVLMVNDILAKDFDSTGLQEVIWCIRRIGVDVTIKLSRGNGQYGKIEVVKE